MNNLVVPAHRVRHGIVQIDTELHVITMCCRVKLAWGDPTSFCTFCRRGHRTAVRADNEMILDTSIKVGVGNETNITHWASAWLGEPVIVSIA